MMGAMVAQLFKSLTVMRKWIETSFVIMAIISFGLYLALNLLVSFEIQWALRPYGFLSLTWDRWEYEEYFRWKEEKKIESISGDQMKIFKEKLRQTGRSEWAENLP